MLVSALENHAAALRVFEEEYSLWDVALSLIGVGVYRVRLGKPAGRNCGFFALGCTV